MHKGNFVPIPCIIAPLISNHHNTYILSMLPSMALSCKSMFILQRSILTIDCCHLVRQAFPVTQLWFFVLILESVCTCISVCPPRVYR
jgi:hypothetical protein